MSGTIPGVRMPDFPPLGSVTSGSSILAVKDGASGLHTADQLAAYSASQTQAAIASAQASIAALQANVSDLQTQITAAATSIAGWQRLSRAIVTLPVNAVVIALPDGYSEYRVVLEEVNAQNAVAQLMMRPSTDGVNWLASSGSYSGMVIDSDGATTGNFAMATASSALITGNHQNTFDGVVAQLDFNARRTQIMFRAEYVNPSPQVTRYFRNGLIAWVPQARWVQFFFNNSTVNISAGARFDVLARP